MSQHAHAHTATHHEHETHAAHDEHHAKTHHDKADHEHATQHTAAVDAVRTPVNAPEADVAIDASRPTPQKPEGSEAALVPLEPKLPIPKEPQSVAVAAPAAVAEEEKKDVRLRAEEALAAYVKESIPHEQKQLLDGLNLELLPVVGYGTTGIKLCFHGPHVTTNAPMLNQILIGNHDGALTKHPALQKFFHNTAQLPTIEAPSGGSDMYHVIIPMSVETYQNVLKELAGDTVAVAPVTVTASPSAPIKESAASESALPQNVVQGPVAALDTSKGIAAEEQAAKGASL